MLLAVLSYQSHVPLASDQVPVISSRRDVKLENASRSFSRKSLTVTVPTHLIGSMASSTSSKYQGSLFSD